MSLEYVLPENAISVFVLQNVMFNLTCSVTVNMKWTVLQQQKYATVKSNNYMGF